MRKLSAPLAGLLAALVTAVALPANAAPSTIDPRVAAEIAALQRDVAARKADKALALTRDQAKALLPLLEAAQKQHDAIEAARAAAAPDVLAALQRLDRELVKGEASAESREALKAAREKARPPAEAREAFRALGDKLRTTLTMDQLQGLRAALKPGGKAGKGGKAGDRPGRGRGRGPDGDDDDEFGGPGGPGGPGAGMKMKRAMKVLASPTFVELVRARAR